MPCLKSPLLVLLLLTTRSCSSLGPSTISIYQSTSNVPPLAESFSEGACIVPTTSRKIDPKWVVRQSTFYVPIASQFTYRLYAETFLSRAGVTDQDVKSMCLTMDFFPDGPGVNVTNTGYDLREFKLTCPVIWKGQFTCLPVGGSAGTNSARARSADNYVVSVDNQSYMLVARCIDGFFRDYMLLTTRPVVSPELYHTVMQTIKELGFDEKKLQMVKYDNCLRTDRFVTAVNVHHHHSHHHHVVQTTSTGVGPGLGTSLTIKSSKSSSVGQLRPSYSGFGQQQTGQRRVISVPVQVEDGGSRVIGRVHSSGGGSSRGGGGGQKVEELEAFYAIIP